MRDGRVRLLAVGIVAASVAVAATTHLVAGTVRNPAGSGSPVRVAAPAPLGGDVALDPAPERTQLSEIDRLIRAYDTQVSGAPNASGLSFLGRLELERARLTGDIDSYARAVQALERARSLVPQDQDIAVLLAGARYTTHDFAGALSLARNVLAEDARSTGALAVEGDAELELGRYGEAAVSYRALEQQAPTAAAVLVRRARFSFLHGDTAGAERFASEAERAATSEGAFGPKHAFYFIFHGKLELDLGHYDQAAALYERAVRIAPDYYVALSGLASTRAAQGRLKDAIRTYRRAVAIVPEPISLAALGDLYTLSGKSQLAERQYGTVETIATLANLNRRLYDRQLALFYADHDRQTDEAVRIAEASLETRKDVFGYDAYAWALYRAGRYTEARLASDRALSLGTPDPKLWYHAGMISAALGDGTRARDELERTLDQSPQFDPLQALTAGAELDRLGRGLP
jgi:tetratricopeptide (TPR) repeat protein